jgi:CMP-N-acetylneuraminic acid synthetase
MINGKSVFAVIPARGGSKRLPGKNIISLAGKPLIAWTILAAQHSKYIDRLIVSTDAQDIAEVTRRYQCEVPFIRPSDLSDDDANSNDVILHALNNVEGCYDIVMILQPTSPLRTGDDIDGALEFMIEHSGEVLVSVCEASKPLHWFHKMNIYGFIKPCIQVGSISSHVEPTVTYLPNGALFIAQVPFFLRYKSFYTEKTLGYIMSPETSVDIDSSIDLFVAEAILRVNS